MNVSTPTFARPRALAAAMAFALVAAAGWTTAHAHGGGMMDPGPMSHHAAMGPGGPGGAPMMGRMLERMLDQVGATPEQRTQIRAIADAASADLQAQRDAGRTLREQSLQLFAQPTVDANAVESQRQKMLQHQDQVSRRMTQAMLDVSRVLTPEQRAQWAERMGQRRQMMERHQHERRQLDRPRT
ncbi:MAG: Spy/CpxP family protein refolding chaperone [Burkholderiaceae bacterium]|nr:Spy/CpxP family protein refolding chaperone [Burkholderiaceae bacterium]